MPTPLTGQATTTGISNAVRLTSALLEVTAWTLKAPLTNSTPVYIGGPTVTSVTGYQLDPGDEVVYERLNQAGQPVYGFNPQDFYVAGVAGSVVTWLASP